MPEANEYQLMQEEVGPQVANKEVTKVEALGKPYGNSEFQKEHLDRVKKIPSHFTIKELMHRGKEFIISTNSSLSFRITFGQGAYLYYLKDLRYLNLEPFKSNAFLGFFTSDGVFLIMDVQMFRHQAFVQVFNDGLLHWSNEPTNPKAEDPIVSIGRFPTKKNKILPTPQIERKQRKTKKKKQRSPCVISQHTQFKLTFLRKFSANPLYFQRHTLAYVMYDDEYCYGLGEYSVSELLCRFYFAYGVKPWDSAYKALLGVPGFLEAFLEGPRIFSEEYKLYKKGYNPTLFRKEQIQARTEFRLNFRLVYGKSYFRDKPIISFFFKERKKEIKENEKVTKKENKKVTKKENKKVTKNNKKVAKKNNKETKTNENKNDEENNSVMKQRNNRHNTKSVWAFCLEENEIPKETSQRGTTEVESIPDNEKKETPEKNKAVQDYSKFIHIDPEIAEDWFRYSGRIITKDVIGVGPHDWHTPEIAKQYAINQEGFNVEQSKDPPQIQKPTRTEKRVQMLLPQLLEKRRRKAVAKTEAKSNNPFKKDTKRGGQRREDREIKNLYRFGEKYKTDIIINFPLRKNYLVFIAAK